MKSLKFIANEEYIDILPPVPSSKLIPKWYRDGDMYIHNQTGVRLENNSENAGPGMRSCMPFFDSLASGYMLVTWCDLEITKNSEEEFEYNYIEKNDNGDWIKASGNPDMVGIRTGDVGITIPRPEGFARHHLVWKGKWGVELPKGWSMLFTHPLNQYDLPFFSLSGIIDSDMFSPSGNLPFFIKKGWTGIIPKGTPLIQLIPIKRSEWIASLNTTKRKQSFLSKMVRSEKMGVYKKNMWHPKKYRIG